MTDNNSTPKNIGPGDLKPQDNNPFLLSKPEFIAVQTYVDAGTLLPASKEDMQLKLGIAQEDVDHFQKLIDAYKQVVTHCSYFKSTIFPMSVELAADIVHYNTKVPIYYGALNPIIDAWNDGTMPPDKAQAKLSAILQNLRDTAQGYANNAKNVKEKMHQFVEETKQDKGNLEPIKKSYQEEYQGKDGLIDTYLKQAEDARQQIKSWNEKYEYDVTVAATSPTYAWIFPFGTIAAAVVAGVYGKRATDDLDEIHKYQEKLEQAQGDLRKALNLMHDLSLADVSLSGILDKLNAALPVLQKMEGIWGAIADDLTNILKVIDDDINKAPAIIKDLGVAEAIQDWAAVAKIADNYRANAYITVTTEDKIKKEDLAKFAVLQAA